MNEFRVRAFLVCVVFWLGLQASALEPADTVVRFFVHPVLTDGPEISTTTRSSLAHVVAEVNAVLAKNTRRRLVFNQETGITVTVSKPQTDWTFVWPENFDIWVHVDLSESDRSYGGYFGVDKSGARVVAGLHWPATWQSDATSSDPHRRKDYENRIITICHEIAHIFGAGIGEYYTIAIREDRSGMPPYLGLDVNNPVDSYFSAHSDWLTDPLLRYPSLNDAQYSALTAAIMNGNYAVTGPPITSLRVRTRVPGGIEDEPATVTVFRASRDSEWTRVAEGSTGFGVFDWEWGASSLNEALTDNLRLVKVRQGGRVAALYISIWDLQYAAVIEGKAEFEHTIAFPAPPSTFSLVIEQSPDASAWSGVLTNTIPGGVIQSGNSFYRVKIVRN